MAEDNVMNDDEGYNTRNFPSGSVLDTSFISFVSTSDSASEEVKMHASLGDPSTTASEEISMESASSEYEGEAGNPSCGHEDDERSPQHCSFDDNVEAEGGEAFESATHWNEEIDNANEKPNGLSSRRPADQRGHTRTAQHIERQMVQRRQQQAKPRPPDSRPGAGNSTGTDTSSFEPVVVLGMDISSLSATSQFMVCAAGVFSFNLSFGFLQEFVAVEICNRNLGLFLAMIQFTGYTLLSYMLRTYVNQKKETVPKTQAQIHSYAAVPTYMYLGLGGLSAIDMAMTNMAMHYINYPAKTLMKSSRVVFTMIFGVLLAGKRYRLVDYLVVLCMVGGLAIFMQADANSSAIFEPMGVVMLTISLICDGATNIMSETIMKNYGVGQDELIFRMYSLALIVVTATAIFKGDLRIGFMWMTKPGTFDEWKDGASEDDTTWNALGKITMIILFSSTGFFGSSCSAAITKNFGALTMSMTSTARRATTLFISFFLF